MYNFSKTLKKITKDEKSQKSQVAKKSLKISKKKNSSILGLKLNYLRTKVEIHQNKIFQNLIFSIYLFILGR